MTKLCKDCKYYKSGHLVSYDRCNRNVSIDTDLIRGDLHKSNNWYWCESEREASAINSFMNKLCGKNGKYWEAK